MNDGWRRFQYQQIPGIFNIPGIWTRTLWPVLATLLLLCPVGCRHAADSEQSEEDDPPTTPVPVHAVAAERTTLHPFLDLVGTFEAIPERTATVSPQAGGWIDTVHVVDGQTVKAGQSLVQLDARLAKVEMARGQAVVQEKEAVLKRLKRGFLPQEIEMARREADKAERTLEGLQSEFGALEPLRRRNEISPVKYRTAKANLEAAQAAHAAALAKLELLKVGTRPEQIAEAEAQLATAEADRDALDLAVQFCNVASPIDGTVTKLSACRGTFVERATPLATVVDLSRLFVKLQVPAEHMTLVSAGGRVEARVTACPGKVFEGTIARVSGQADPATGNLETFAEIANENAVLRPGLVCLVRLWLPAVPNAVAVPIAAVADHSGRAVVTVVRDAKAYEVDVKLGVRAVNQVQILEGVSAGDIVVTKGGYGLPDGCPVRIASESAPVETSGL